MQDQQNKKRLEAAFPPMDAAFDRAVRSTLDGIVQKEETTMKHPLRITALALALILCLAGTAVAVGNRLNLFNFFDDLDTPNPTVQPEAYALTAYDAAAYSFAHTDVAVREAAWDGRVLRILYSVRDRTVDQVLTDAQVWAEDFVLPGAQQDGISAYLGCDYVYVNGQSLSLTGTMASRAGDETGEVLVALECDLAQRIAAEASGQLSAFDEKYEVWLPILRQNGQDATPQELHFIIDSTELAGVSELATPAAVMLEDGVVIDLYRFMISPIRVYVQADVWLPADITDAQIAQYIERFYSLRVEGLAACDYSYGIANAPGQEFVQDAATGEGSIYYHMAAGQRACLTLDYSFATSDAYPEVFRVHVGDAVLDVPNQQASAVNQ